MPVPARGTAALLAAAALGLLTLALTAAPASAALAPNFCPPGQSAGQCNAPLGVAVDNSIGEPTSGNVYLANQSNRRIDAFDSAGHFLLAFGWGVRNHAEELQTCTTATGCEQGTSGPGPGQMPPASVAVDNSPGGAGDLYVSDPDHARIQKFSPAGEFLLAFGGGVLAGGATATGNLTAGSATVTSVKTTSRAFAVGQTITGAGIPAGTRITGANPGNETLTLSQPATASGTGVALTAPTPPANNPNNEVQTVTVGGGPSGGTFSLEFNEFPPTGRRNVGGRLVATTASGSASLTSVSEVTTTGDLTAGSTTVTVHRQLGSGNLSGKAISGVGIPPGTTITADDGSRVGEERFFLSQPATATATAVALSVISHGKGNLTAGSNLVSSVVQEGTAFLNVVGQTITGTGIPAGTTITAENLEENTVTLSQPATATATAAALTAVQRLPLVAGETVSGPGIPPGTTIASVAPNSDLTLSANATASATAVGLHAGLPFDATAAELESSLEALANIGAGNVEVSGPAGGPWTVEFKGRYADTNVEEMRADGSGLTPSGSAEVTTTVGGASAPEVCTAAEVAAGYPCLPGVRGSGAGQFGAGRPPVAVDSSGHVWVGDVNRIEQFSSAGAFLSEVKLPGSGEISSLAIDTDSLSPSFGDFYTLKPGVNGANEEQEFSPPSSGTYTLTFEGQTTTPIPFHAVYSPNDCPGTEPNCLSVQSALEALSTIGPGNVSVGSGEGAIRFVGAFTETDVEQITASAGATVTTRANGRPEIPGVLSKRKPDGELIETLDASGHPNAVTVDPASGDLFVSDQLRSQFNTNLGTATLLSYDPSGAQLEAFGAGEVIGHPEGNALAFGAAAQRLYVVSSAGNENSAAQILALPEPGPLAESGSTRAAPIHKVSATLCAKLNPEGAATKAEFQYLTAAKYEAQKAQAEKEGKTAKEVAEAAFAGALETPESASLGADFSFGHELCQPISPLQPATSYRFRIVAHNANGEVKGEAALFTTQPPAAIDSTSTSDVTSTSATLQAEINPLGDATAYRFEYLTEAAYLANGESFSGPEPATSVPVPDLNLGSGVEDVAVSQHLQNLQPHTAYRYRVLAVNAPAPTGFPGPAHAFTTQSPGAFALPDSRAWELVSPPDKHGAAPLPIAEVGLIQASAQGDAITYRASAPTEAAPQGNTDQTQLLSTRGPLGWSSRDLTVPHAEATGASVGEGGEYRFFSADLSLGVLQPFGAFDPALSAAASEQTAYLRADFPPGHPAEPCVQSCYRPIVTGAEGFADVPPGTKFGLALSGKPCPPALMCGPRFLGATPDLSHLVLEFPVALTATPLPAKSRGLYEWSASAPPAEALRLLSVLPGLGAKPASAPDLGSSQVTRGAISADGSRVVWSESEGGSNHLYLRYNATQPQSALNGAGECTEPALACTLQLDAVQGGSGSGEVNAQFQLASADGSRVFFTDNQRLTADSGASAGNGNADLYECRITEVAGQLHCGLTDLSPESSGEAGRVQGLVLGASEDGSSLYFVAAGVLAHNKVDNGNGEEEAQPGNCAAGASSPPGATCNLYLRHGGTTRLAAVLSAADQGDFTTTVPNLTARVSANGRRLAFMSQRPLTGYDNRDAVSGKPDQEVFLYHAAASEAEAGKLICASCDPTGARPRGVEFSKLGRFGSLAGRGGWQSSQWLAANVPGWPPYRLSAALHQPRYLSDSGRLFFNSSDALVPADTNGTEDVYQYEPPGVGDCTTSSPTFGQASGGCVSLISSGTSPEESGFLDASESGDDVFFLTAARLSPNKDLDSSLDVYDARVGGGEAEVLKPVECSGDACQQPAVPPNDPTPGSLTFQGAGNVVECPKGKVKKAGKCVAKHHKKKHPKKNKKRAHKRANSNRGGHK